MANRSLSPQDMAFYQRDEVQRLIAIFGKPKAPRTIVEDQFDGNQEKLEELASKRWHELDNTVFDPYLLDMAYVPLQGGLFMYLFPAILIRWCEYLSTYDWNLDIRGIVSFYYAILHGNIFEKVIPNQADDVLEWMAEVYIDSIKSVRADQLTASFGVFNALGQSCIVTERIWSSISIVDSPGKCQWLLGFFSYLIMPPGLAQLYAAYNDSNWYGYEILSTDSDIYDTGYLEVNRRYMETVLTFNSVQASLESLPESLLSRDDQTWVGYLLEHMSENADSVDSRISKYLWYLDQPEMGYPSASLDKS